MRYKQRLAGYEKKKKQLIEEFALKIKDNKKVRLGKSTSNLFRHRKNNHSIINVREFNNVINIDAENLIAEVEGMITYEELVKETLKHGVMPTVVPELKSITLGGAVTGIGIESSSFKYGLVHETITEMEILLSDGSIAICTAENKHKDLFFGFPNSYGTLGYALKLKVRLIPVKKYVQITHLKFAGAKDYFNKLQQLCMQKDLFDFIDGTIFNEHELYITLGKFVDKAPYVSNYKYLNIYYKSIQSKNTDYLTISDYIWRWDSDWFWCSKHFGAQNMILRFLAGKWLLKSTTYWKIRKWNSKYKIGEKLGKILRTQKSESVVQDIEVPIENCEEFVAFFHKEIGIKPIWVCPTHAYDTTVIYDLYDMDYSKLYINFGFWDMVKTTQKEGYYNQKVENKVRELQGKKSLYSTSFYTEKEFWDLYNKKSYDKLKRKYDSRYGLSNLYDKCVMRK
ncbi:MAG: FAD-binding oxidoreductase [Nanoarchaeota archaeon]|nr:FAD-binding oxidoreductase [Nanoarchaeota archaeon]